MGLIPTAEKKVAARLANFQRNGDSNEELYNWTQQKEQVEGAAVHKEKLAKASGSPPTFPREAVGRLSKATM